MKTKSSNLEIKLSRETFRIDRHLQINETTLRETKKLSSKLETALISTKFPKEREELGEYFTFILTNIIEEIKE